MVLIVDRVAQEDDGDGDGDDGDEGSGGWFCKFSQGRRSLFIISEGRDGKLGGLRSKQADITRTYCELSASTCQGSGRFEVQQDVIKE